MSVGLFGLGNSNHDFSQAKYWGKNIFNNAFPVALCCYMASQGLQANYVTQSDEGIVIKEIPIELLFSESGESVSKIYFEFESTFTPFERFSTVPIPRSDLVVMSESRNPLRSLEIKLTVLPDHVTRLATEADQGAELVVRPDSVVYLAYLLYSKSGSENLSNLFRESSDVDFGNSQEAKAELPKVFEVLEKVVANSSSEEPFLLQPIWRTVGDTVKLAEKAFDVFVWSQGALVSMMIDIAAEHGEREKISRMERSVLWLFLLLRELNETGETNWKAIVDGFTYGTKNDKAFAIAGPRTNKYMRCDRLQNPIIGKSEVKNIVLGGGHELLSPERRLDASLSHALNARLFDESR